MWSKTSKICSSLFISLMALMGLLAWLIASQQISYASDGDVYCVVPVGYPTGSYAVCDQVFTSVQTAVSTTIGGEEIRIAAGIYTDVHTINDHKQLVYIDKIVTLRGGYVPPFDMPADPVINHTILDAEQNGRVVYIASGAVVTLTGVHITGGDATYAGDAAAGGGIYAKEAQLVISGTRIYDNVAYWPTKPELSQYGGSGGGIFVGQSDTMLINNVISGNLASFSSMGVGGGFYIQQSQYFVAGNEILSNTAQVSGTEAHDPGFGGGGAIWEGNGRFSHNTIKYNLASDGDDIGFGGGFFIEDDRQKPNTLVMEHNIIAHNTASQKAEGYGGGIHFMRDPGVGNEPWSVWLHDNLIQENVALVTGEYGFAGGIAVLRDDIVLTMTNNTIISNTAVISGENGLGGGLIAGSAIVHSANNQFIGNSAIITATQAGSGGGVYYENSIVNHENDVFIGNQATQYGKGYGGAFYQDAGADSLGPGMSSRIINSVFNDNQAFEAGSAIMAEHTSLMYLIHATVANNQGKGATIQLGSTDNTENTLALGNYLWMTNTIMSGNETGLYVGSWNEAVVNGILWHDTQTAVSLAPNANYFSFYQTNGDPLFATDGYHIQAGSAAIRRGIPTRISRDIDGQGRPYTPTLGVDEYWLSEVWLPFVSRQ